MLFEFVVLDSIIIFFVCHFFTMSWAPCSTNQLSIKLFLTVVSII